MSAGRLELVVVHVDGGARGNPGPAAIGCSVATPDGEILAQVGERIGHATNNVAEYRALIRGIELAAEFGARQVELVGDSELIVHQVRGEWKVKDANLRLLRNQAIEALAAFDAWTIRHVRREHNATADALVNRALDA